MNKRVNLIPMAGAGQRFVEAGFVLPKPLIAVGGEPMIVRAAQALPPADEWIFVCRQEHIDEAGIDVLLKQRFPGAVIVIAPGLTSGQAVTCLLGKDFFGPEDGLTIGACDNTMLYSQDRWSAMMLNPECDAVIWTFRNNPAVLQNPAMYGWVEVDGDHRVQRVSVKVPISSDPMRDHAVIGAFSFKRANDFVSCAQDMIRRNRRINGEYYVDEVMNIAVEGGLRVKVFEVDRYVCWGTPRDLMVYDYWRDYFVHETQFSGCSQAGKRPL
jgi:dTDP-glucose pyrophosphorylase